jgi:hypothetical protein
MKKLFIFAFLTTVSLAILAGPFAVYGQELQVRTPGFWSNLHGSLFKTI